MSIMAVGLIRATDTSALVVGNIYFKKMTTVAVRSGIEAAMDSLGSTSFTSSYSDIPSQGYYASCNKFDKNRICDGEKLKDPTFWDGATPVKANSDKAAVLLGIDSNSTEIKYVVERMCNYSSAESGKAADQSKCIMSAGSVLEDNMGCSNNSATAISGVVLECTNQQVPLYRATFRVVGLKNSISYFQLFFS